MYTFYRLPKASARHAELPASVEMYCCAQAEKLTVSQHLLCTRNAPIGNSKAIEQMTEKISFEMTKLWCSLPCEERPRSTPQGGGNINNLPARSPPPPLPPSWKHRHTHYCTRRQEFLLRFQGISIHL
ncbi:unnamed protein product [Ixodes pacificus]